MKKSAILSFSVAFALCAAADVQLSSPDGKVKAVVSDQGGALAYSVTFAGREVLAPSPVGIRLDGTTYGASDTLGKPAASSFHESFPWLGSRSEINVRGKKAVIPVNNSSGATWQLEVRCFNDAVAWRAIVPGAGERKVTGERSAWVLPAGTVAWCNPVTAQYEGVHERWDVSAIPIDRFTNGIGMPVTFELPGGGFAALTEAEVMGYSGMTVEPTGTRSLASSFRDDPQGWTMRGEVRTPWRVLMVAADLDGLVNCAAVPALCSAPDKALFPKGAHTDYLKPGRCLWQWWAYDDAGTLWEKQQWFVDQAAALNCQYYLVDEGWEHPRQKWATEGKTAWQRMKELCDYAAAKGVGIWIWSGWTNNPPRMWPGLETPEKRQVFFDHCVEAGVKGVKIDFMDSESHDRLAFYQDCLRVGAEHKIMVNFHGANKPAGESRTWPNEMTREGVRGLEYNKWDVLPPHHYATVPFTRYLAGNGDFTPTTLQASHLKGTTVAQQLACAVVTTSPILCWADKPDLYLQSPIVDVLRSMPPVWDETRVLHGSKIGDLAVMARRSGKTWYVGILNGAAARSYTLDLSFIGRGKHQADFFSDTPGEPLKFQIQRDVPITPKSQRTIQLSSGGGFVARIRTGSEPAGR